MKGVSADGYRMECLSTDIRAYIRHPCEHKDTLISISSQMMREKHLPTTFILSFQELPCQNQDKIAHFLVQFFSRNLSMRIQNHSLKNIFEKKETF